MRKNWVFLLSFPVLTKLFLMATELFKCQFIACQIRFNLIVIEYHSRVYSRRSHFFGFLIVSHYFIIFKINHCMSILAVDINYKWISIDELIMRMHFWLNNITYIDNRGLYYKQISGWEENSNILRINIYIFYYLQGFISWINTYTQFCFFLFHFYDMQIRVWRLIWRKIYIFQITTSHKH